MKKSEREQLKSKSAEELERMVNEYHDKLWSLKTDLAAGKVKNVREIRKIKRDVARILTLLKA